LFDEHLKKNFTINVTDTISKYVGHEVLQEEDRISIHAAGYIHACLQKFGLEDTKPAYNPGVKGIQSTMENSPETRDRKRYMSLVGCIQYIANTCRPDIAYTANFLARCQIKPQQVHVNLAKRVLRYLKTTSNYTLTYKKKEGATVLKGSANSDWVACKISRKSTSGYIILLNGTPIDWKSKRQKIY